MSSHIISENMFLLYSLLMGAFVTFVYDLFRILRRVFKHHWIWVSLEDILFWFGCGITVFLLMQRESNGMLRWFAVVGALTGMCLYRKFLGKYLVDVISRFLLWIKKMLSKPLGILAGKCRKASGYAGKKAGRMRLYFKNRLTRMKKTIKMILCKQ